MTRTGPGKFEGNESKEIAEKLYEMLNAGMADEEAGDISEMGWYSALFSGILLDADGNELESEEGGYITDEDEQGFFTYTEYDTNDELEKTWQNILALENANIFCDEFIERLDEEEEY